MATEGMTHQYPVEHGIPMPPARFGKLYPWEEMGIGDSFFVPVKGVKGRSVQNSLKSLASRRGQELGRTFKTRIVFRNEKLCVGVWRET